MEDKSRAYYQRLLNQYINGTITQEDRFTLEKHALDDPFMFEALEGLQNTDSKNIETIGKLKGEIESKAALNRKTKRIPLFNYGIAASLILLLGAGMWFFNSNIDKKQSVVMSTPTQDINTQIQKSSEEEIPIELDERNSETKSPAPVAKDRSARSNNQYDSPKAIISQVESESDFNTSNDIGANNSPSSPAVVDNSNQTIIKEDIARLAIADTQQKENDKTATHQKNKTAGRQASIKEEAANINITQAQEEVTTELSEKIEMASDGVKTEVTSTVDRANAFQDELDLDRSEYITALGTSVLAAPEEGLTDFRNGLQSNSQKQRDKKTSETTNNILIQFHINEEGETSDFEIISGDDQDCINTIISQLKNSSKWITVPSRSAVNIQLDLSCN